MTNVLYVYRKIKNSQNSVMRANTITLTRPEKGRGVHRGLHEEKINLYYIVLFYTYAICTDILLVFLRIRLQILSLIGPGNGFSSNLEGLAECLMTGKFSKVVKTSDICGLNLASLIHCNARIAAV